MATLSTYVSDEDYDRAKEIAIEQHMSVSKMLKMAFNNAIIVDQSVELELINQVKAIGINVNQIAKRCNTKKVIDRLTYEQLVNIRESIEELLC